MSKAIIIILLLFSISCVCWNIRVRKELSKRKIEAASLNDSLKKQWEFYRLFVRWIQVHNHGKSVASYCKEKGIKRVAIYGMKEAGELLLDELEKGGIEVPCGIDRDADNIYVKTTVIKPSEKIPDVDIIVVTAIHFYKQIEDELKKKVNCPIVSLLDVLCEISLL